MIQWEEDDEVDVLLFNKELITRSFKAGDERISAMLKDDYILEVPRVQLKVMIIPPQHN